MKTYWILRTIENGKYVFFNYVGGAHSLLPDVTSSILIAQKFHTYSDAREAKRYHEHYIMKVHDCPAFDVLPITI